MNQHWHATSNLLQINSMPFYWRLSKSQSAFADIAQRLPIRVIADSQFDFLKFEPTPEEWAFISEAYRQNENIGFLNPESGHLMTYGASVNNFFLDAIRRDRPARIFEIGCGAGYSIRFLRENGFEVTGIDPSEYSKHWSERIGFSLINEFFGESLREENPDFIYCNDVFEHIPNVIEFSRLVYKCLDYGGAFCFATTNSGRSIDLGDVSMLEHQHVNMFTDNSLRLILRTAGFSDVKIENGSYGNTFHVIARKSRAMNKDKAPEGVHSCSGYFEKASKRIMSFHRYYSNQGPLYCYVPLRCIPYLATVGDFSKTSLYDSNYAWRESYIDGYGLPIRGLADISYSGRERVFVGSITFYDEICRSLMARRFPHESIASIETLS